jgi:hypothetical protein
MASDTKLLLYLEQLHMHSKLLIPDLPYSLVSHAYYSLFYLPCPHEETNRTVGIL